MRIGVLGSGGREHALQWCLARSAEAEVVFALPGNGGTPDRIEVDPLDVDGVRRACDDNRIDLLVVGPEAPLAAGVVDAFAGHRTAAFGPIRAAARLESSKIWAKRFMTRHGIPTADYALATQPADAVRFATEHGNRAVLKADGLAAGKGVSVCHTPEAVSSEWERLVATRPQREGFLVEELLDGWELSIHVLTDGTTWRAFPPSQDHKPLLDGDAGPNTGGMGAYAPVPACGLELMERIAADIVEPTLRGLQQESIVYRGFLYFGLMIAADGPRVLEYNVRLGDPETQVMLPQLQGDLLPALLACLDGRLHAETLDVRPGHSVGIVLASAGYPDRPQLGRTIHGIDHVGTGALVFHAGTRRDGTRLVTAGGRVLTVVGQGGTLDNAIEAAYCGADRIRFAGAQRRSDIGRRRSP